MKEYHVVLEGKNGFQKEEDLAFTQNHPSPTYYVRDYQQLSFRPLSLFEPLTSESLTFKERCFRLRNTFYALGKNIAYYTEEV